MMKRVNTSLQRKAGVLQGRKEGSRSTQQVKLTWARGLGQPPEEAACELRCVSWVLVPQWNHEGSQESILERGRPEQRPSGRRNHGMFKANVAETKEQRMVFLPVR